MSEATYMKANDMDCSDYRRGDSGLEIVVHNVTIEEVEGKDLDRIELRTPQGDVFATFEDYVLQDAIVAFEDRSKITLRFRHSDDPIFSRVTAMEGQVTGIEGAVKEHGDALDALIQMSLGVVS